jgi:hypothetical protein
VHERGSGVASTTIGRDHWRFRDLFVWYIELTEVCQAEASMNAGKLAAVAVAVAAIGLARAQSEPQKTEAQRAEAQKAADLANERSVTITSPINKSKISGTSTKIVFEVTPVPPMPKADHVHVFVDGDRVAQLRALRGSYEVDKLAVGRHWLCVRVVDKRETPVGLEKCAEVNVGNVPEMGYK